SLPERLDRELAAPASQEVQISRGVTSFEHLPCERNRSGNSGRILVDIKGAIKMRNPEPFELEFGVDGKIGPEIGAQQFAVDFLEAFKRKWLPSFFRRVRGALEFGEHCLAKESASEVVDLAVQHIGAHPLISCRRQQVLAQQDLVEGGGDLREEDRIMGILIALRPVSIPGMHGMSR